MTGIASKLKLLPNFLIKFRNRNLEVEQNKLRNGSQGLKDELEKLKSELKNKSDKLQSLKSEQDKLDQIYNTTALAAATGGSVDDKRRYIGALQMAKGKRQSNLTALQQSVSNYDVSEQLHL